MFSKDAKLCAAIRTRASAALVAVLASALFSWFASSSTAAFGIPQSNQALARSSSAAAPEAGQQISVSQSGSGLQGNASAAPKTVIPTHENLRLTLKADCANVEVFTNAQNEVSYQVRVEPAAGADADVLRRNSSLTAHNTPRGVVLVSDAGSEADCRAHVAFEIHVPHRYDLNIAIGSGDISTQDVDGVIMFAIGAGNIRAGSVALQASAARGSEGKRFIAQLQTGGGDISVGDVAGGLRAATAGGQILAGDVRGPAVLRTGGGDIRVGHVFGAARFDSGGGDIIAQKIDGGVWADTSGGRIEIGNAAQMGAILPGVPAGERESFRSAGARPGVEREGMPSLGESVDVTEFARLFDALVWGAIRVDPADQQKRLVNAIAPDYPDVARLAGIEGDVTLRLFVGSDGTVRGITPISGPPVLARATMRAVEQWRYAPALVEGHPVGVVTTVTLAFRLHP